MMVPPIDLKNQAQLTLNRLVQRLDKRIPSWTSDLVFQKALQDHWIDLFSHLYEVYSDQFDLFYHLEELVWSLYTSWSDRSPALKTLDRDRLHSPNWFLSPEHVGATLYVDLFAGDLHTLKTKIPYFQTLGITYIHLMPLFKARDGQNDGGYAIADYRTVDPNLGTMEDLKELAEALRKVGIALVLDFVFNHTADDHEWAKKAQEGDLEYQQFYYLFDDDLLPRAYGTHLRDIFPSVRKGCFTWKDEIKKWVWTTFNSYQWDLNYSNPAVFVAIVRDMLFLANCGIAGLRLDAVAFIWKELGTTCENRPQAHTLIQALNSVCRIAAPSLFFKSEAIVHPDEVIQYIHPHECQLSYNPTFMALMWESLATRKTTLLKHSLSYRQDTPLGTTWINYLRCHDDIGWSFDNADAWQVGINPDNHRGFLNAFYTGRFKGSFAKGVPFQFNEENGDLRICGTLASLMGVEQALSYWDSPSKLKTHVPQPTLLLEMALKRLRMAYGVVCSMSGIPLLYMGEEWGDLNQHTYLNYPDQADDARWTHRLNMQWTDACLDEIETFQNTSSHAPQFPSLHSLLDLSMTLEKKECVKASQRWIFKTLQAFFFHRKQMPAFHGQNCVVVDLGGEHVLSYLRWNDQGEYTLICAHFSEHAHPLYLEGLLNTSLFISNRLKVIGLKDRLDHTAPPFMMNASDLQPLWLNPYAIHWFDVYVEQRPLYS